MYALGYSLDNLSLMALTISTGFVVDDAIVMIENISRYIEEGEPPMEAALKGAEQIGFTILSLTVSLIAVLIPLLFMGDVVGRLFREFAVTLAVTIVISAVVSLTLTPMMSVAHSATAPEGTAGAFLSSLGARFRKHDRVLRAHAEICSAISDDYAVRCAGHSFAHDFPLHHHSQRIFPGAGHGRHSGHLAGAADRLARRRWRKSSRSWRKSILDDPAVESLSSFIGADGTNTTTNSGRMSINLKPLEERKISASDVIRRLEVKTETRCRESSFTCSRCRTSPWTIALAARNTNTRWKIPIRMS